MRAFVTGHTGFKGRWLTALLERRGWEVTGYSLPDKVQSLGDLLDAIRIAAPDIVYHLAAQALVRDGHKDPRWTFETNARGTWNVLEACERLHVPVLIATTDKVYRACDTKREEGADLWGNDPYSGSKVMAEMAASVYARRGVNVATVRAGNCIGAGDHSFRLIPNACKRIDAGIPVFVPDPDATRPFQHVLDCLHGYTLVADQLIRVAPLQTHVYNFGPEESWSVRRVVEEIIRIKNDGRWLHIKPEYHEEPSLLLDSTRARQKLGWHPVWDTAEAVRRAVESDMETDIGDFERAVKL